MLPRTGTPLAVIGGVVLAAALIVSGPTEVTIPVGAEASQTAPARVTGVHGGGGVDAGQAVRWTDGQARVSWPAVAGFQPRTAEIVLDAYPGRVGDQVAVTVNGAAVSRHRMSGRWDTVRVDIPDRAGPVTLDIQSLTHRPPTDARDLGVRIASVTLRDSDVGSALAAAPWWQGAVIAVAGMVAWLVGCRILPLSGAGPYGSLAGGVAGLTLLGVVLWWSRLALLHDDGLRAVGGAVAVAVSVGLLLSRGGVNARLTSSVAVGVGITFLVLALVAQQHFVDVPRWDIWEIVTYIEKLRQGTLRMADLWAAHNTHRPLTGRILLLSNVVLTRWNHWFDLGMVLVTAALQLLVVAAFVARTQVRATRVHPASLIVVSLLVFTLVQWENWLQGWQVLLLLGALATSAALLVLAEGRPTWPHLSLAAACGAVAMASFASCLLVWPLGLLAIAWRRDPNWTRRLVAWLALSAVAIAVYAWDLPDDPSTAQSGLLLTWGGIRRLAAGVVVSLGTPVFYRPGVFMGPWSVTEWTLMATGMVGLSLAVTAALVRRRQDVQHDTTWVFPTLLCLFGLGAGAMAALGRVWLSVQAMTASRYVVFGACFWVGVVLLLAIRDPRAGRGMPPATVALLVTIAVLAGSNWVPALEHLEAHFLSSSQARTWLLRDDIHAAASVLYPDPHVLDERRQVLQRHGLSLYRPGAR